MSPTLPSEPAATAIALVSIGVLCAVAVLLSPAIGRRGVPVVLFFMLLGMLAGSEGIVGIEFEDYSLAFRLGTVALVFILFDGGLNTSFAAVRPSLGPASVLATLGVALTAGFVAVAGRLVGLPWMEALLLGAVVSSTDAAAVFSVLRGSGVQLKQRVAATLELESGLNDPMAVILTIGLTNALVSGKPPSLSLVGYTAAQLAIGAALGVIIGLVGRWLLLWRPLLSGGLYPVLTLSMSCLAFAVPTLFFGSGFLAVYVTGLILGNGPLPYRSGILRAHDFVAWSSQIIMFLALGLLSFPSQLVAVIGPGLIVAGALALLARPLSTLVCLLPFRYSPRELVYVGWVGLRGAVPIILAMFPMMAGAAHADRLFNIVFFVVVVSALVQGWSVRSVTHWLGLETAARPPPPASVEISSALPLANEIMMFFIDEQAAVCGQRIATLSFPDGASVMLIVRGRELIAPKGSTELCQGDYVYVFCRPGDLEQLRALFDRSRAQAASEAGTGPRAPDAA